MHRMLDASVRLVKLLEAAQRNAYNAPMAAKKAVPHAQGARELLQRLEKLGKPSAAHTYARHGVREPSVGLSFADLNKLVRELGTQHELAMALWTSAVHDARMLATKICDPERMTTKQLEAWLGDASNYVIVDAIAALAAQSPRAAELAQRWIARRGEWQVAAGWNVLAALALKGALSDSLSRRLLERIRQHIHTAPNRARHSMNGALIAMGGSSSELRSQALDVAKAIGKVEVDHGQTGCKTPDAGSYIRKMAERSEQKAASRARGKKSR